MKISWKKKRKTSAVGATTGEIGGMKRPNHAVLLAFESEVVDEAANGAEEDNNRKQQQQRGEKGVMGQTIDSEARGDFDRLAESFRAQGNLLAEGRYHEALGKWEAALNLAPENAVLHEQKAQVLLEVGDAWNALRAAKRATELEPSWSEAWVTLGRAQLNFGEPDLAVESLDKALAIKPNHEEAQADHNTAVHLVNKRKQMQLSDPSFAEKRYEVRDSTESDYADSEM